MTADQHPLAPHWVMAWANPPDQRVHLGNANNPGPAACGARLAMTLVGRPRGAPDCPDCQREAEGLKESKPHEHSRPRGLA